MTVTIKEKAFSEDGSIKYVFFTSQGQLIEGIYFRIQGREDFSDDTYHICISSQAGCAMGCTFCATGYGGFFAQLSSEEMCSQVDLICNDLIAMGKEEKMTGFSVGLMGMGEPLMNYENIVAFCYSVQNKYSNLEAVCISTIGISPRIEDMAQVANDTNIIRLFVSIHSPYEEQRLSIMPITKKYSIQSVLEACRTFHKNTGLKIILSYLLIRDVNDSEKHAEDFAHLIANDVCFTTQLLLYNETPGIDFMRPSNDSATKFKDVLSSHGIPTIIQISKGQDIDGGCGQLVKKINQKSVERRIKLSQLG